MLLNKFKIFCISYQRTGTTSTGRFFKDHGFRVANWEISHKNKWSLKWFKGDYDSIFRSSEFKKKQVFEDSPWWHNDFYKVLFHKFPNSKFILLERDPDKWFNSMMSHSKNKTLGNTHMHSFLYHRLDDFYKIMQRNNIYSGKIDNLLPLNEEYRQHYKSIYINRNKEIKLFFNTFGNDRLFIGKLEDSDLWQKMGSFFNIHVSESYAIHANKSITK